MLKRSTSILWGVLAIAILLCGLLGFELSQLQAILGLAGLVAILLIIAGVVRAYKLWSIDLAMLARSRDEAAVLKSDLQEQGQAIDFFADGLDLGIFICDEAGTVSYTNRTAREMFEFSNPIGRSLLTITVSYDLEQLFLSCVKTHELQTRELVFPRPVERNAIAKAWMNADSHQVFVSILDVSNLRRLERVRQDFVANVSHELRTPMSIIRAYAETLLDEETPDPASFQDKLPKMIAEVDRLSGLTRDLLILSAAELEVVQKQKCDIGAVCEGVASELRAKAEGKNIKLTYTGPSACFIEANPPQMKQVILNLVDNAINYTVRGSVKLSLDCAADPVVFKVTDTGLGIALEHSTRIFERFYRVDKGRSRSTGGTGLGLSIVKHIVEAHNGNVRLDSALNEGSTFTVWLPKGNVA